MWRLVVNHIRRSYVALSGVLSNSQICSPLWLHSLRTVTAQPCSSRHPPVVGCGSQLAFHVVGRQLASPTRGMHVHAADRLDRDCALQMLQQQSWHAAAAAVAVQHDQLAQPALQPVALASCCHRMQLHQGPHWCSCGKLARARTAKRVCFSLSSDTAARARCFTITGGDC